MYAISKFCFLEFQLAKVHETKSSLRIKFHELVTTAPPLARWSYMLWYIVNVSEQNGKIQRVNLTLKRA